jgi:hypothetical protein
MQHRGHQDNTLILNSQFLINCIPERRGMGERMQLQN